MLSLRECLTPPVAFSGSLRRALRDDYLEPAAHVSVRAQLARQVVYESVILMNHGVDNAANLTYGDFVRHLEAHWPRAFERTLFVPFWWDHVGILEYSTSIGTRTDLVYGMTRKAWAGTAKLADAIGRIQSVLGRRCPICVVAHSQGGAVTLAAAQEGLHLDNVVLMGSPLDQTIVDLEYNNTRFSVVAAIMRGELINLASTEDGTTMLGGTLSNWGGASPGDAPPQPIGRRGLPPRLIADPRFSNIMIEGVDHWGEDGWWSADWQATGATWVGDTPEHLVAILSCRNLEPTPVRVVPRGQRELAAHAAHVVGDTRPGWSTVGDVDQFDQVVYIPGQAVVSWHFSDKDFAEYAIAVQRGQLRAQLFEAVGSDFERSTAARIANAGAGVVTDRLETAGVSDALYRLTVTNPGVEPAVAQIRFRAENV